MLAVGLFTLRAAAFEPLSSAIPLPAALQDKPVWVVEQLSNGQLAVGVEGILALGSPFNEWQLIATPNGQVARNIIEAHGRTLVSGHGFVAFIERGHLQPIKGIDGEFVSAESVAEGWIISGSGKVWLIRPDGSFASLPIPNITPADQIRIARINDDLIITSNQGAPSIWQSGALVPAKEYSDYNKRLILWVTDSYRLTDRGLRDKKNQPVLQPETNRKMLTAGIVGLAETGPLVLIPTLSEGLFAITRSDGKVLWNAQNFGEIYCAKQSADRLLVGGSKGLFSISNPAQTAFERLDGKAILGLQITEAGHAALVTAEGVLPLFDNKSSDVTELWPEKSGASVIGGNFTFNSHHVRPLTRFINGLALVGSTAAIAQDEGLTFLNSTGASHSMAILGIANSLAADGRHFLVGTSLKGVKVISEDGQSTSELGSGRAAVREVRPGKVVLLFWDGTILDSDANTLGQITWGNPRDAALVSGRLAVLVTRPDRDPVVGLLEGQSWQPLEIPGLAEIGAEKIAATDDFLFAAGPRGVIRVRLPLTKSAPPTAAWSWTSALVGDAVQLPSATDDHVGVNFRSLDLAPAPATFLRLRTTDGAWSTLHPGADFQLPVSWGRTSVTLQAERNGLLTENTVTVVRPWPLWLRWWAWPLHAAALAGLIFALVRWRTRTLKQRNLELEKHVSERTEELRKASAVKEEFLASVSHEIRNPLNGVVGICAILADREVGPSEKTLVRTLGGCADQLRSMLDDILDFSRIERGQVTLTNVDFEAGSLVEEAARAMDPELAACSLMLPDQPAWLHGDSGKLRQIVCNLISNALKYGVPSEAGVEVRLSPAGAGRTRLRLAVRNTGPTIPPEELTRLFESFQRGSNTGSIPGSGLGLAVCRRLAHAMGGRITAASHEGTTEFALELTLVNAQPPAKVVGLPDTVSRALAIEDEEYNRVALGHVLRSLGYTIDWAVDGASALKFASTQQYDLVLTDWRLPDTDGGELCRQLVKVLPRPTPPIVAITAYSTKEKLEEAKAAGMTGFVTKPVTKEKLERVIRGLSEGLRPKRSLDTHTHAGAAHPLASLGDIAPSTEQLAHAIDRKWREVAAMTRLHDPRAGSEAHTLRGQLLQAGEETAAEQVALLEDAVDRSDWPAVARLLPEVEMLVTASQIRLKA